MTRLVFTGLSPQIIDGRAVALGDPIDVDDSTTVKRLVNAGLAVHRDDKPGKPQGRRTTTAPKSGDTEQSKED